MNAYGGAGSVGRVLGDWVDTCDFFGLKVGVSCGPWWCGYWVRRL